MPSILIYKSYSFKYFYIDKLETGQGNIFSQGLILFNAIFMVFKALVYLNGLRPLFSKNLRTIGFILYGLMPLVMHFSRAVGTIEQVFWKAPLVNGACLRIDLTIESVV